MNSGTCYGHPQLRGRTSFCAGSIQRLAAYGPESAPLVKGEESPGG